MLDSVYSAVSKKCDGAYAIPAVAQDEPDKIVAVRKDAPLTAGLGKDSNFIHLIYCLLKYVKRLI